MGDCQGKQHVPSRLGIWILIILILILGIFILILEWETVRLNIPSSILLLCPFRNPLITIIVSRWGSSRRAQWRSWWSPWPATPGSSSPPTSTSSSPPIGLSLHPNKCSTYSQKGKQLFWTFWWVSSCHNYDWYSEPRCFWGPWSNSGVYVRCGGNEDALDSMEPVWRNLSALPNLPFFTSLFTLMFSIYLHQYIDTEIIATILNIGS